MKKIYDITFDHRMRCYVGRLYGGLYTNNLSIEL